jgi:hypothetical protein
VSRYTQFRSLNLRAAVVAALMLCVFSGCYEHISRGNESIYRFAWWVGPAVIGGGILAVPIGWLVRKRIPRWGFALMGMGPFLIILIAPAMYRDHVLIDDEHFEASYGVWFQPTVHLVRFDDLSEIHHVAVRDRRGSINYEIHCLKKDGQTSVVHAGTLVKNTVPELLARARAKGVRVLTERP